MTNKENMRLLDYRTEDVVAIHILLDTLWGGGGVSHSIGLLPQAAGWGSNKKKNERIL